jgi:hypothetical protein
MLFVLISILGLKIVTDCGNYSEDRGFTASILSAFCLKLMEAAFFLLYRL